MLAGVVCRRDEVDGRLLRTFEDDVPCTGQAAASAPSIEMKLTKNASANVEAAVRLERPAHLARGAVVIVRH